jgi:hypothetical protein
VPSSERSKLASWEYSCLHSAVLASGTDKLVTGLELYNVADAEESVGYTTTYTLAYAPLLCSPTSAEWKKLGNAAIREFLRDMLDCAGYGRSKGE